ncbi:probable 1-acyl-sn-glycerol-3-phosphate acyltransferase 5 [Malania oleifera]|uniref:probable 1-acyl-sn-glycerol-3-phosphate acyltransferase 5 n=1 Tax=Malania oleifera TaxID=397392 RepID=UPI0025ADBC3B|nr:probable 1-acyl-sn-glycerol-3-phosphate acyltransferase 5 [Malania oleifera]XP_057964222.1 probable 1-acyl-sn-glycerol-3-phosphate acyltransferase 5 [Malania oleifera]
MEVYKPFSTNKGQKHRALTPIRALRGLICLVVLFSTAFVMLVFCGFMTAVVLRLFSIHYSRKATSFFFGAWLALWPFLFEKINKTRVIFSGENIAAEERVLIIANHRTEVDWMYLWDLALRKQCHGYMKYILKSSLMKLPVFGWGFHILEFISVERRWELDESTMRQMLSSFKDRRDPLWLVLFPEGTDFTEQKCIKSQKYAAENGLPLLKNVLLPKTKGFCACLEDLRCSLDAVYDVTIAYKPRCPFFLDNVLGVNPSEVHMHIRRIPLKNIPTSEDEAIAWLMDAFHVKDQLLSDFYSQGHFPHQGTEGDLSSLKCYVNFTAVFALTCMCMFLTFFSSIWFRMYVSLACAYLASATYFNIRPLPMVRFMKTILSRSP